MLAMPLVSILVRLVATSRRRLLLTLAIDIRAITYITRISQVDDEG